MTRAHIAAVAAMLKDEIDTAVAHRRLTEADAIARVARRLAVEFAHAHGSFRFHTFYRDIGLTTDGFRPVNIVGMRQTGR